MEINNEFFTSTMKGLKEFIDINSIVGAPIITEDDTMIIPVSKVSFGFVSGGGEYPDAKQRLDKLSAGVGGGGFSITPLGFLVCSNQEKKFMRVDKVEEDKWTKLIKSTMNFIKKDGRD